jgi:hypothetical protein
MKNLILASLLLSSNLFAASNAISLDTKKYEVTVTIKAVDFGDSHDSSNEYKLDLKLQEMSTKASRDSGNIIGVFKASHSKNIYSNFSRYDRLKIGQSITRKAVIVLPQSVLDNSKLQFAVYESDFSIPIPGPCCININNDDLEMRESIELSLGEQEYTYFGPSAEVNVKVKLISSSKMSLVEIIEAQLKYFYSESYVRLGESTKSMLQYHILKNI